MKLFIVLLLLSLNCLAKGNRPVSLYRTQAEVIHPETFELTLFGSYFTAVSSYDAEGVETTLAQGQSFTMMEGGAELKYCFNLPFEVRAGLQGRSLSSNDGTTELTAQGLESYWVGMKYGARQGKDFRYAFDVKFRKTTYSNTFYQSAPGVYDEIELGDAGSEISLGLNLGHKAGRHSKISGSAYYRMLPNELSPEVAYNLEVAWAFRNLAFFLGTDGIYSLGGSKYDSDPDLRPAMSTGISQQFNSVNRSLVEPYLGFNLAFSSIRLSFKGSYGMAGVSTDRGYRFLGSLTWSGNSKKNKNFQKHKEKIRTFKEYEIEASVIKVSPRGKFVKIDQGMAHDVEKGMIFDIYKSDYFGGNVLLASGRVYEVGATWAIIKINKKYREVELKPGLQARGL